jgi:Flp pilus assembly protein TadG
VRARADAAQAVPIVVALIAVALLAALVLADLGRAAGDRARARTAADVAALAGAAEGEGAARDLARANGALLERFAREGDSVEVTVRIGEARATSRARRETVTVQTASPPER